MKVLFDPQIFTSQVYGGVSKYFAEVIARMPADSWTVPAWLSNNEYARHYGLFKQIPFLPKYDFRGKGRFMVELIKPSAWAYMRLKRKQYDVVHQTNFDTYLFNAIGNKPLVTTYHDINFLTEHNYVPRMVKLQTASLRRADAVVAISNNTKADMLRYFDIDPAKIRVIYHGIDTPVIPETLSGRLVKDPYILYVGARHLFKNFDTFITAFAQIAHRYPEVKVVCTRSDITPSEGEMLKRLGVADRVQVVKADEMTLNRLYRDALFFVFPSKYEGFGMPILEAMVNGCPVALANASCFPEIAGDSGLYFDPSDVDSIAGALERMLDDENLRSELREKGYRRAAQFSWQRTADMHI
ncbi:MAG: glycosyltransferase family 4 protein, partial [Muribaculaceae bacterium]|nr:glycosyltransferase family 4 protein [Muribaculaceae bacterium]